MGMSVSVSCDRQGCQQVDPSGSADGWFSVRHDGGQDVWVCSVACLQQWAAGLPQGS